MAALQKSCSLLVFPDLQAGQYFLVSTALLICSGLLKDCNFPSLSTASSALLLTRGMQRRPIFPPPPGRLPHSTAWHMGTTFLQRTMSKACNENE